MHLTYRRLPAPAGQTLSDLSRVVGTLAGMSQDQPDANRIDAFFAQVIANIEQYGTHVTWVGADDDEPPFTYTAGLAAHDHPEFVIYGLGPEVGHSLVNTLSATVLDGTKRYAHGDWVADLVANDIPVRLVAVDDSSTDLTVANALFRDPDGAPIPALQVIFPDKHGLWSWQQGSLVANLPVKGPVPDGDAGVRHVLSGAA